MECHQNLTSSNLYCTISKVGRFDQEAWEGDSDSGVDNEVADHPGAGMRARNVAYA